MAMTPLQRCLPCTFIIDQLGTFIIIRRIISWQAATKTIKNWMNLGTFTFRLCSNFALRRSSTTFYVRRRHSPSTPPWRKDDDYSSPKLIQANNTNLRDQNHDKLMKLASFHSGSAHFATRFSFNRARLWCTTNPRHLPDLLVECLLSTWMLFIYHHDVSNDCSRLETASAWIVEGFLSWLDFEYFCSGFECSLIRQDKCIALYISCYLELYLLVECFFSTRIEPSCLVNCRTLALD